MWFGNLVTPEFWTQLWLKEGVARYMEFVAVDELFPEWKAWDEFVQSVYSLALNLDGLESSHPVEVPVTNSDEISEIFDAISYAKGASIIRMLSNYISTEVFMKGMRLYLTNEAYGNAVSEDFWQALSEVSGKPLVEFMKPWTNITGFPILQLHASDDNQLTMTTNRFYASGAKDDSTDVTTKWPMPVTARVEGSDDIQGPWVIHGPEHDDSGALLQHIQAWTAAGKWFKLNADQFNFYRVNYTPGQWSRLATAMDPSEGLLSATDRLGLISDSFAAGKAGYSSVVDSLRLAEGFADHKVAEYVVWQELSSNLSSLASLYRSEPFYPKLQQYLSKLYSKQASLLGWDASPTESARTGTLRGTVLRMMGVTKDSAILEEAYRRFLEATKADSLEGAIPGDLRRVLFRLALRDDEDAVYQTLKRAYEEQGSLSPEAQRDCLVVMGCVQNPKLRSEMLYYTFFSGKVNTWMADNVPASLDYCLFDVCFPHRCTMYSYSCCTVGSATRHRISAERTFRGKR
jgi:aminopeptidase N